MCDGKIYDVVHYDLIKHSFIIAQCDAGRFLHGIGRNVGRGFVLESVFKIWNVCKRSG